MRKDGLSQDGSFLAAKIENEDKREVLEQTCTIDLKTIFGSVHVRYTKTFRCFLSSLPMNRNLNEKSCTYERDQLPREHTYSP